MLDEDAILKARIGGKSVRRIARENGCSEGAIDAILDRHAGSIMSDKYLRRAMLLELQRLDDYVETFHQKAIEGDPVCGALCVKISERRATLLGLNAPLGLAVRIIHDTQPQEQQSSTDRVLALLDRIAGKPPDDDPGDPEALH